LWVLVTVAGLSVRDLASRRIPQTISNNQVSTWGIAAVAVLGAGMMPFQTAVMPSLPQAGLLAGAVIFGTGGYWAITAATRLGEVSVVSPFRYSRLIFAILIGALAFGERPDLMTFLGAAMIISSGLYAFARERARRRAA
jgi:drug/metabolite transporter (DMT)-like permease